MNSLFLRIYGGMLLVAVLVAASSYVAVQHITEIRADYYRSEMTKGTFYLIGRGIARHEGDTRRRWLKVISDIWGGPLNLIAEHDAGLSRKEVQKLNAGNVVMVFPSSETEADIYARLPTDEGLLITSHMSNVSEKQARATAVFLLDELGQFPIGEWDQVMGRIQRHFAFPIKRVAADSLFFDKNQYSRLLNKEVVVSLNDKRKGQGASIYIYTLIGNTGDMLVMGPLFLFETFPLEIMLAVGIAALLIMGGVGYLFVRPLEFRLKKIAKAARLIGRGDLDARVDIKGSDAIAHLGQAFNGMTEHIQRLIESQQEMTRAVSHELRTPVARIRFGLEMLVGSDRIEDREAKVDELDGDIDELNELIDEILTYAKLEQGIPKLQLSLLDIPKVLARVEKELDDIRGDIHLVYYADVPLNLRIAEGEERYVHRLIQNLVTNAIRYARTSVQMRYSVKAGAACIEVEDDGPGIDEADWDKVFTPFARLDTSRNRASGGYGLGLSIVQRIIEWHGGHVQVSRSRRLGGAMFTVSWPLRQLRNRHVLTLRTDGTQPLV